MSVWYHSYPIIALIPILEAVTIHAKIETTRVVLTSSSYICTLHAVSREFHQSVITDASLKLKPIHERTRVHKERIVTQFKCAHYTEEETLFPVKQVSYAVAVSLQHIQAIFSTGGTILIPITTTTTIILIISEFRSFPYFMYLQHSIVLKSQTHFLLNCFVDHPSPFEFKRPILIYGFCYLSINTDYHC